MKRQSTHRQAIVPLILYLIAASLTSVTIAWGRSAPGWEMVVANEPRYWVVLSSIATLCIGLLMMPIQGASFPLESRSDTSSEPTFSMRSAFIISSSVLLASLFSSVTYAVKWNNGTAQPFEEYVTTAMSEFEYSRTNIALARGTVPERIVWGMLYPENLYSRFFAQANEKFDMVTFGNDLKTINDSGEIVAAAVLNEPSSSPGPIAGCGYLINEDPITIDLVPNPWGSFWLTFGYLSEADSTITVEVGGRKTLFNAEAGLHTGFVEINKAVDQVIFTPGTETRICIDTVRTGPITPMPGNP